MNEQNIPEEKAARRQNRQCNAKNSSTLFGTMLVVVGGLIIASRSGLGIPSWILSWPMILITVGLVLGISSGFRKSGWFVPLIIGLFFLLNNNLPEFFPREYFWPAFLVIAGLVLIFRPFSNKNNWFPPGKNDDNADFPPQDLSGRQTEGLTSGASGSTDGAAATFTRGDRLNETAVFGNVRRIMVTKAFIGGEVSAVFGSAEINLMQTDFQHPPHLELNAVFGSIKLIVPSHWQVKFESNAVLGGIEDKRPRHTIYSDKVLFLEANAVFGGIQIESH